MSIMTFKSDTPIIYYDESIKLHLTLTASWEVESEAKNEYETSTIKLFVLSTLTDMLREYQRSVPFRDLSLKYDEISFMISEKLTAKMQFPCQARLTALTPDDRSAQMMKLIAEKERLSDPAVMAAEYEKAMRKAQETAEKNGLNIQDIVNQPMPDLPQMPDSITDPLERAKAMSEYMDKLKQTAVSPASPEPKAMTQEEQRKAIIGGMLSDDRSYKPNAPAQAGSMGANTMAQYRPKFCKHCGTKLPPTGNFCGNCGKSIL